MQEIEEIVYEILTFGGANPEFDRSFAWDMQDILEEGGTLTPGQEAALRNIHREWKIGEWMEDNEATVY